MKIEAQIASANGDKIASEVSAFMREEFGAEPERNETRQNENTRDTTAVIAIISLGLAVPSALNNSIQLAEKARLNERVHRMVTKIRTLCAAQGDSVLLRVGDETALDLRNGSPDEVVEAIVAPRNS